jgi:hypothetical protein
LFWFSFLLSECNTTGRYGINSESHCHTCVNKICDKLDGNCTHGCIDGFREGGCHITGYRLYILDCSSLIVPSVFSTVYILLVLLVTNVSVFKLLYLYCYVLEHVSCTCYVTTAFSKSVNAAMCTISVKFVTYLVDTCMTMW